MFSFGEAEHVFDIWPVLAILTVFPVLIVAVGQSVGQSSALASNQLRVYRMPHFDLHNSRFGSRSSLINLEAITVRQVKASFTRKCVLFNIHDLIDRMDTFDQIIDESMAAILIIIPETMSSLSEEELNRFLAFERSILSKEISIPIYLTEETQQLRDIYETQSLSIVDNSSTDKLTVVQLLNTIFANGYQFVVSAPQISPIKDAIITNVQGSLIGSGAEDQLPTIAIVAHYDSFGIAPGLSFGTDSNGSGIVALLEMVRLFSKLYANSKAQPKVNLLFLLSGAGKFNYIGSKKWIEEHLDSTEGSILSESLFTICLDSLADSENNSALYMHVSKPPKEGSAASNFYRDLQQISMNTLDSAVNVSINHKKINLADETLAWEHERFSIRRLPAFTLSSFQSPKSLNRKTITDVYRQNLLEPLYRNIMLISEALVRQLYDDLKLNLFTSELQISKPFIKSLLSHVSNHSRAQNLLLSNSPHRANGHFEVSPFLVTLERIMRRYASDVQLFHVKIDQKEPDIVFYEPSQAILNIYNVKPAIFDLFLTIGIAIYLAILYVLLINFHHINKLFKKIINSNDNNKIKL